MGNGSVKRAIIGGIVFPDVIPIPLVSVGTRRSDGYGGSCFTPHLTHTIAFHDKADPFRAVLSKSKRVSLPLTLFPYLRIPAYP